MGTGFRRVWKSIAWGKIVDTKVLKSLGDNGCDEAAIAAIKAVQWIPAKQKDQPVKVWVGIPVVFKLKE